MLAALRVSRPLSALARTSTPPSLAFQRWKQTSPSSRNTLQSAPSPQSVESDTPEDSSVPKLEILSRPLGVNRKPSANPQSWQDRKAELLDYDKHLERRRHLVKEASKGYFRDFHALRHNQGKTWIAPKVLIREDRALYYPDVTGVSLTPQETVHTTSILAGRISLISMISTVMSEENVKSFTIPALEAHESNPLFRFVQINLQENPLKGFLVSMFLTSIRARIPAHLQSTYLVSRQNMEYLREPLGMVNKHIGYVYLVDENCKVRWAGCGFADDEESLSLRNCARVLLGRLRKTGEGLEGPRTSSTDSQSRSPE